MVTPYAGVWIEISEHDLIFQKILSLPTRECGLKFRHLSRQEPRISVTPYAGVWIEIRQLMNVEQPKQVTPYAGVWIEIRQLMNVEQPKQVTPYAGVWIEIS